MSKKLANDFSWSVSRHQLFTSCPRAYWFNHYGSWGGWEKEAPERTRKLYILKNIRPMVVWLGSIVHDLIKDVMTQYSGTGHLPSANELKEEARRRMNAGWKESVRKDWEATPKKTNLFEHYYGGGVPVSPEQIDTVRSRVFECLDNFSASAILKRIQEVTPANWKPIDTLDTFVLDGLKIWCAVDFAYTAPDGILHILDWKTGSEKKEALRFQLACYALYSMDKWGMPLDRISPHGVFLYDGARCSDYTVDDALLNSAKEQIIRSAQAMKAKLRDVANNVAEEDDFPCQPASEYVCQSCNFRAECPLFKGEQI